MGDQTSDALPQVVPPPSDDVITVTGRNSGPSAGDIVRVGGAAITNPTGVGRQLIRNEKLIEAGDDFDHQRPTIGPGLRIAEAFGDGANDRAPGALAARFNEISGFSVAGVPVVNIIPGGGVISTVTDFTSSNESLGNRTQDLAVGALGNVPVVGAVAGIFQGNKDVNEVRRGIRLLSDNNIPGFRYDESQINGHSVRIYVSAADTITGGDTAPWVNVDTDGINKWNPDVQARVRAITGQAQDGIYNLTTSVNDTNIAAGGQGASPSDVRTELFSRMRDVITQTGVAVAPVESARITSGNSLINGASVLADMAIN